MDCSRSAIHTQIKLTLYQNSELKAFLEKFNLMKTICYQTEQLNTKLKVKFKLIVVNTSRAVISFKINSDY